MRCMRVIGVAAAVMLIVICAPWLQPMEAHNPTTTTVLFHREVVQILNAKCASCHKPNGMSMPLQTYDEVRPWAVAIKEEVLARRMPPWPAERGYGAFANDAGLTLREQEFLISWIEGGVPRGDGAPPPYVDHSGHWMLGAPEHIYTAPAASESPRRGFRRYVIETRRAAATFVRAFDFNPGDSHARAAFYTLDGTGQFLGGWTPGHSATQFPEPSAVRLPPNARVLVDVLSTSPEPPSRAPQLAVYVAQSNSRAVEDLVLTPTTSTADAPWNAQRRLMAETTLLALRIDSSEASDLIEIRARRPDGSIEPLLLTREFADQWQTPYVLGRPLTLPAGSVIEAAARFAAGTKEAHFSVHVQAFEPAAAPVRSPAPQQPDPPRDSHHHH